VTTHVTIHQIYMTIYGKVRSGGRLSRTDQQHGSGQGARPYNKRETAAVALAVDDAKKKIALRTVSEVEREVQRLLSPARR